MSIPDSGLRRPLDLEQLLPRSMFPYIVVTFAACTICSTPMVWTRVFVHAFVVKLPRWDDGLVVAGWIGLNTLGLGFLLSSVYYPPADDAEIAAFNIRKMKQVTWIMEMVYAITINIAKLSVLILYKRIFVPSNGKKSWIYYTIISFMVFNTIFYSTSFIIVALSCIPARKIWDDSVPGQCIEVYILFVISAALNVMSDAFMVIVPVAVIANLQMPRKRKAEVLCVFSFGVFCTSSAIIRFVYSVLAMWADNQAVAVLKIALWAQAEITACLITASVPMVPLMVRYFKGQAIYPRTHLKPIIQTPQRNEPKRTAPGMSLFEDTYVGDDDSSSFTAYRTGSNATDFELDHVPRTKSMAINGTDIVKSTTYEVSFVPKSL